MFEKNLQIGYLLDFYGGILPERKREITELYYNDDLSLSEVAEQFGITRQAVRETVKKTEEELLFYEERLGLLSRFQELEAHTNSALGLCEQLQNGEHTDKIKKLIAEINSISAIVSAQTR